MKIATDLDVRGALTVAGLPIAAGSVILSGTATPTAGTGAAGDYYLDNDDLVLYGPKLASAPEEFVTPTGTEEIAGAYMYGSQFQFAASGFVSGVRVKVPATATLTGWEVYLFTTGGALLASKDAPTMTANAWNQVNFDTPVVVASSTNYVVAFWTPNKSNALSVGTTTIVSGNVTGLVNTVTTNSTRDAFPASGWGGMQMNMSPVFTTGNVWPVALKSVPAGGTTSQVLAKTSATDYAATWATPAGGAAAPTRATVSKTTASLAAAASEASTIQLGASYRLLKITTSAPARVRLYTTAAKRDADAGRSLGTDPTGDSGLMLEFATATGALSADLSPVVDGFDGKVTPDGLIPYSITNLGTGAAAITVGLDWVRTEG